MTDTGLFIERERDAFGKFKAISWPLVLLLCFLALAGGVALYSAAGGSWHPWAMQQAIRFAAGLIAVMVIAMIDLRVLARLAYPAYAASLALLLVVELVGQVGMGAQRWLNLGIIQLQPSELCKITLVLALARYFHGLTNEDMRRFPVLVPPLLMTLAPAALTAIQPDLGTALILCALGAVMLFLAGARLWKFAAVGGAVLAAIPVIWQSLEDYQRQRVLTFLDPESDPLGAGWNTIQAKIALGSGGVGGKGFLQGTQAHLNFLPEAHTDFILALLAEEWGLIGAGVVLVAFMLTLLYGFAIALRARSHFGRLLALGISCNLFFYVFINAAMVMGLLPVVGVPLPLISYGGTALLAVMAGFGLLMSVLVHRDQRVPR